MGEDNELEQKRLEYLERHGYMTDHLATLVEDLKCQAANAINNRGVKAQLKYLMDHMTWSEMVETLQAHRSVLEKYWKKSESKLNPEKNR
jgi:hypothetical protein